MKVQFTTLVLLILISSLAVFADEFAGCPDRTEASSSTISPGGTYADSDITGVTPPDPLFLGTTVTCDGTEGNPENCVTETAAGTTCTGSDSGHSPIGHKSTWISDTPADLDETEWNSVGDSVSYSLTPGGKCLVSWASMGMHVASFTYEPTTWPAETAVACSGTQVDPADSTAYLVMLTSESSSTGVVTIAALTAAGMTSSVIRTVPVDGGPSKPEKNWVSTEEGSPFLIISLNYPFGTAIWALLQAGLSGADVVYAIYTGPTTNDLHMNAGIAEAVGAIVSDGHVILLDPTGGIANYRYASSGAATVEFSSAQRATSAFPGRALIGGTQDGSPLMMDITDAGGITYDTVRTTPGSLPAVDINHDASGETYLFEGSSYELVRVESSTVTDSALLPSGSCSYPNKDCRMHGNTFGDQAIPTDLPGTHGGWIHVVRVGNSFISGDLSTIMPPTTPFTPNDAHWLTDDMVAVSYKNNPSQDVFSTAPASVPEFSLTTMLLAVLISGFVLMFVIRRKK